MRRLFWVAAMLLLSLAAGACQPAVEEDPAQLVEDDDAEEPEGEPDDPGEAVTLTIESWRSDDIDQWENEIIPAFEAEHPNIALEYDPTAPTEYDAALSSRLEGGTAGDILTLRSYDRSRQLFEAGHLEPLDDLPGIDGLSEAALGAFETADGDTTFGVPVAAVIHGFYYNTEIFEEVGVEPPATTEEFLEVLAAIDEHGEYAPLAWGTADDWIATSTGFDLVGPNFWHGEEGRQALLAGEITYEDDAFVAAWEFIERWREHFPSGFEAVSYEDMQTLFGFGDAAVFPGGSWEISLFRDMGEVDFGVFAPPVPPGQSACYINDHPDMGIGMNAATDHPEEARTFLEWAASAEFAQIFAGAVPGFFPIGHGDLDLDDPAAEAFASWRADCDSTARLNFEDLTAGEPNIENEARRLTVQMWNEGLPPAEVAAEVQAALASWYEPHQ
jgi:raffinose/stachyose/melibiose transport system substrate-binding protein